MIKRYIDFVNEEAPVNMYFYNDQKDVPVFDETHQSVLEEIGFDHITKHYATMKEGSYLIKALPVVNNVLVNHKDNVTWLESIKLSIYSTDNNGKTEFYLKTTIPIYTPTEGDRVTGSAFINGVGTRNGSPGVITDLVKKNIIKFIVDNIPSIGLHNNKKINLREGVMNFTKFNTTS